jgi:hypothetical protein
MRHGRKESNFYVGSRERPQGVSMLRKNGGIIFVLRPLIWNQLQNLQMSWEAAAILYTLIFRIIKDHSGNANGTSPLRKQDMPF